MKAWLMVALAAAGLAGLVSALPGRTEEGPSLDPAEPAPLPPSQCPKGSLPDNGVCIPVPEPEPVAAEAMQDPSGGSRVPRRPDRPADFAVYVLPVDIDGRSSAVSADLGSIARQALGGSVGRDLSGVLVRGSIGRKVTLPSLESQDGDATWVYAGDLVGPTAVTLHRTKTEERARDVLLVFGNLQTAPDVKPGASVARGAAIGSVGATLTPDAAALYLEARLLRPGVDATTLAAPEMLDPAYTVSIDVRNVLPLLPGAKSAR